MTIVLINHLCLIQVTTLFTLQHYFRYFTIAHIVRMSSLPPTTPNNQAQNIIVTTADKHSLSTGLSAVTTGKLLKELLVVIGTSGRRCSRSPLGGQLATTLSGPLFSPLFFIPFHSIFSILFFLRRDLFS